MPRHNSITYDKKYYAKRRTKLRAKRRRHYRKTSYRWLKYLRDHRARLYVWVAELKAKPCTDCGIQYPHYVMDFDHVRGKKSFAISIGRARLYAKSRILKEIAKCDLVCANCHRERTHKRT